MATKKTVEKKDYKAFRQGKEEKALNTFADLLIEKIESMTGDNGWEKPWFDNKTMAWPTKLDGRKYNGMNAVMLYFAMEKFGYNVPVWGTFNRYNSLNDLKDKNGEPLPYVAVKKGAHSFPICFTSFVPIHKETKERITFKVYQTLPEDEQKEYKLLPRLDIYNVFNIDQTNLAEARPELYAEIQARAGSRVNLAELTEEGMFSFKPLDVMIADNKWICPITPKLQERAYYSMSKKFIVVPEKRQFKNGESFYGTLLHEMTHSTGAEGVLNRFGKTVKSEDGYAKEELVAELGSALVAQRYGMSAKLQEENCKYLKEWLDALKQTPQFIKTILNDVKKASDIITKHIVEVEASLGIVEAEPIAI